MESKRSQRPKRTRTTPTTESKASGAIKKAKATASEAAPAKPAVPKVAAPKPAVPKAKAKAAPRKASGPLKVGTVAPPFSVKDQDGAEVTLTSLNGKKNVVVYFYPKDNTPGCIKEACKFRDLKDEYDALDCVVLGVSADTEASHGKFIAKFGLQFSLLADTNRSLVKSYGASKAGGKIQRSTVLVDKEGKVAAVWNPVKGAEQHPVQVLAKLKEMV